MNILRSAWNLLLAYPLMNVLLVFYALFGGNFGWAVIAVAIITRLMLLPATKKQMLMTQKMSGLKPKLEELKKKYANNQEQLAKEQMKLYKEVGYNPVGCLGTFLPQMLILAALISVIRALTSGNFDGIYPFVQNFVFPNGEIHDLNTNFMIWDLSKTYSTIAKDTGYLSFEALPYLVLGVAVGLVQYVSSKFMQVMQTANTPTVVKSNKDEALSQGEMQEQMTKSMTTIFPLMTAFFTLTAPAVLGVYWFVQSLMMVVQYFLLDKERSKRITRDIFKKPSLNVPFVSNSIVPKEEVKTVDAVKVNKDVPNEKSTSKPKKKKKKNKKKK